MKTFYEFIKIKESLPENYAFDENVGALIRGGLNAAKFVPDIIKNAGNVARGIGNAVKTGGKAIKNLVPAGASIAGGLAVDSLGKLLQNADNEEEIERILNDKVKEAEKILQSKVETNFKNFSTNLSNNLNKIIKINMEEFKKKMDAALAEFIK